MPCTGPEPPNEYESAGHQTIRLLCGVEDRLGLTCTFHDPSKYRYCRGPDFNRATRILCGILRELTDDQIEDLVYNSRDRFSRQLADWWEDHQELDRQREEQAALDAERQQLRIQAIRKLSLEEMEALGVSND